MKQRHVQLVMFDYDKAEPDAIIYRHFQTFWFDVTKASTPLPEHDLLKIFRAMNKELDSD